MNLLGDITNTTIGPSLDCPTCGQHFTAPIRRQQHMTYHRPRNLMCYSCKNVEVQFPCYSAMVQHMMTGCGKVNSHELDWLISCWYQWSRIMIPEIRRKIRQRKELAPAATYQYDEKLGKYFCSICNKTFKLEKGAQMHATSNIHSPNIYRCPACQGEFPSFGALLLHAESLKCSLIIKMDSTLAKLLHFLHLKLTPQSVTDVIKEDLGVLVSKVAPPASTPGQPAELPAQIPAGPSAEIPAEIPAEVPAEIKVPAPAPDVPDLIDLGDPEETNQLVEDMESLSVSTGSVTLATSSNSRSDTGKVAV